MTIEFNLKNANTALNLHNLAFSYGEDVFVSNKSTTVDARSILALFTLVGKTVNLVFPDGANNRKVKQFADRLAAMK